MLHEIVPFQMLLNVCTKLNWSKIDQRGAGFNQFRQLLIEVTTSEDTFGQGNEDKTMEFLEK